MKYREPLKVKIEDDSATGYDVIPVLIHVGLHKTATTWL
jgi:hypothetical protein